MKKCKKCNYRFYDAVNCCNIRDHGKCVRCMPQLCPCCKNVEIGDEFLCSKCFHENHLEACNK